MSQMVLMSSLLLCLYKITASAFESTPNHCVPVINKIKFRCPYLYPLRTAILVQLPLAPGPIRIHVYDVIKSRTV